MKFRHKLPAVDPKFKPRLSPMALKSKIMLMVKERGEQGMSVDEIDKALFIEEYYLPIRTIQRRLGEMQPELVIAKGNARATRYYTSTAEDIAAYNAAVKESKGSKPTRTSAKPVDQHQQYLTNYQPLVSSYLSDNEKHSLAAIGNTGKMDLPAGSFAKQILPRFMADLTCNSCRLEGNSYSFQEVQQLIKTDDRPVDKTFSETQMIINHKEAIDLLVREVETGVNMYMLTNLHAIVSDNLLPDPSLNGMVRSKPIDQDFLIFNSPIDPILIDVEFDMIITKAKEIEDPFERSFFLWVHLSYLQPFERFNSEVSRLAMNIPFIQHNLSPVSFGGISVDLYTRALVGLYESNRVDLLKNIFLVAYKRSAELYAELHRSPGDPALFKMKYRDLIRELVARVVKGAFTPEQASVLIREKSLDIEEKDRAKFIEYGNRELVSLHEGNVGRFRIRPAEFKTWQELNRK